MKTVKKKYLYFSDYHLSEALHTLPGQLSSEREQRKQQNQEPVMEDFHTSVPGNFTMMPVL